MPFSRSICVLTLVSALAGQAEEFRLETYVPPDYHSRFFSVTPSLNWTMRDDHREEFGREDTQNNRAESDALNLNHGSAYFSQARRWDLSTGFALYGNWNPSSDRRTDTSGIYGTFADAYKTDQQSATFQAFTRLTLRQYIAGRWFLEPYAQVDGNITPWGRQSSENWHLGGYVNPTSIPTLTDSLQFGSSRSGSRNPQGYVDVEGRATAGYGRIQQVTGAAAVLFLLDRLSENLGHPVTLDNEGMRALMAFVEARRKQRPFLDRRGADVYDIESICEFLRGRLGLEALSSRAVLEMADEWNSYLPGAREQGWEAKLTPFAKYKWNDNRSHTVSRSASIVLPKGVYDGDSLLRALDVGAVSQYSGTRMFWGESWLGAEAKAEWKRPWRRFFQYNLAGWTKALRIEKETGREFSGATTYAPGQKDQYLKFAYPRFEQGLSAQAGWYPSSRTSLLATLSGSLWQDGDYLGSKASLFDAFGRVPHQDATGDAESLALNGTYRINPRAEAKIEFVLSWYQGESEDLVMEGNWPMASLAKGRNEYSNTDARLYLSVNYYLF